ncbi:MAG: type II toxin-antitoxin system VapC family toxin [Planctomycetaceae bacterium]|nr:type II toxin-antitoxin system VapC family toxin [Planctomycetaceae bacterium]
MRYLLDTNVVSESIRVRPDPGVTNWLIQNESGSGVSEFTIGELVKGAYRLPAGKKRNSTLAWIAAFKEQFADRLLPVSLEVLFQWGELCGTHEAQGHRWPLDDSLLAATALIHDLTVVTRNTADFPPEVRTLNPWKK